MDLGSRALESDDEVHVLIAKVDHVRQEPARFASRCTFTVFGLAATLLLIFASFAASSWAAASKVVTSMLSEVEDLSKENRPMPPFDARLLKAVFDEPSANTFFEEIQMDDGTVSYRHRSGLLVTAKKGKYAVSSPSVPGSMQFFGKTTNEDGTIALMVHGGSWLTALPSGEIIADGTKITAWQTFVPKKGENGTVALRNIHGKYVGLNQTLSEEFVADRNTLMEDDGFSRQATAADAVNVIMTAEASSIGPSETFSMINNTADATVSFKTQYGTFLTSLMYGLVCGDLTIACGRAAFTLILKHGKVYLRTFDGWYITVHRRGFLVGDARQPGLRESFDMECNDDGTVALKSFHGKYITATKVPLWPGGGDRASDMRAAVQ